MGSGDSNLASQPCVARAVSPALGNESVHVSGTKHIHLCNHSTDSGNSFLLAEILDLLNNYPPLPQLLSSNYQFPVSMNFVSLDAAHDRNIYYFVTDLFLLV